MPASLDMLELTAQIVTAYVTGSHLQAKAVPGLIRGVYGALANTAQDAPEIAMQQPAVPIRRSVFPDYIVCLEDGKAFLMLKQYLRKHYGLTPEQYRTKWGLPSNYPMVAPNYANRRSEIAKAIGLGRKRAISETDPVVQQLPAQGHPA